MRGSGNFSEFFALSASQLFFFIFTRSNQSNPISPIELDCSFCYASVCRLKKAAKRSQRIVCAVLCCAVISEKWTNVRIVMVMVAVLAVATLRLTCEERGINACHNLSQSSSSSFAQLSSPLFFFFFSFLAFVSGKCVLFGGRRSGTTP